MQAVPEVNTNNFNCFSSGCPMMQFSSKNSSGDYEAVLNFEKYPHIRVKTGKMNGKTFTKIVEDHLDDPMGFTGIRTLHQFDKEMMDMTLDKLQTILVFG